MAIKKRVRLTSDGLNSYGFRVLTSGIDLTSYENNPILLYMHRRGEVVGIVENIEVSEGEISGELVFDEASELSQKLKKQWEFGSLRMVSLGLDVLESSMDPSLLVEGQTNATVTRSRLYEVSLVDVGANYDAYVLRHGDSVVNLCNGNDVADAIVPRLVSHNEPKKEDMELKRIALALGLPETSTEDEVMFACENSVKLRGKNAELLAELEMLRLSAVEACVDTAISSKLIESSSRSHFIELGKQVGVESLESTFKSMAPRVSLSSQLETGGGGCTYTKLSDVPESELRIMRDQDREQYARLYKAEYGVELEA